MNKVFTQEDLLKYVYNECSETEKFIIEEALVFDTELKSELEEIRNTVDILEMPKLEPKRSTIDNVLNFSKSYSVRETKYGKVELNLN